MLLQNPIKYQIFPWKHRKCPKNGSEKKREGKTENA